jgi:hypothetical protein
VCEIVHIYLACESATLIQLWRLQARGDHIHFFYYDNTVPPKSDRRTNACAQFGGKDFYQKKSLSGNIPGLRDSGFFIKSLSGNGPVVPLLLLGLCHKVFHRRPSPDGGFSLSSLDANLASLSFPEIAKGPY